MTGPGGREVARVTVRVAPDTSKLPGDLRDDLNRIEKSLRLEIGVEVATRKLREELERVKRAAKNQKVKLDVEVDGDGVARETRRLKNLAQKYATAIKLTASIDYKTTIARIRAQLAIINKLVSAYRIRIPVDLVSWTRLLGYATVFASILISIPHLIGAIGGALSVVGGLMATLPALAAGFAIGISTLVVGMQGFWEALGNSGDAAKFEESLKNLTPSAQSAARALAEFREPLSEIRKAVQERLFEGMDESFRKLKALLPEIKSGLAGTAGGLRDMGKAWIDMATAQDSQDDLARIFFNTTQGLKAMEPVLANIGAALKDFAVVGSSFFVEWGTSISNVTERFREWAAEARKTGEMREWIENALSKIQQLGRVVADVWVGFSNISEAIRGGREFLDVIEGVTQSFRAFTEQASTQAAFTNIGKVLSQIVDVGSDVFGELFRTIGDVLKDAMPFIERFIDVLGTTLIGIIRIVGPMLQGLARFFSENKEVLAPLVVGLLGLVTAFKLAATAGAGIKKLKDGFDALKSAAELVYDVSKAIGGFVIDLGKGTLKTIRYLGMQIAAFARWAAFAASRAAYVASSWILSAYRSMMFTARYYAIMAAQAIAQWAKMAAAAIANAVRVAAAWLATYARIAVAAMATALRMAAAWIIAMGPIAIVIAAIIGLVAVVIANWDAIWAKTVEIWNSVWGFITDLITDIKDWIVTRFNDVVGFFRELPGKIGDALSGLWDVITTPFRNAFDWVMGVIDDVKNAFADMLGLVQGGFKAGKGFQNWPGKEDGGSVIGGKKYIANEAGIEMYTDNSGQSFLMAGPMGEFTPPSSGTVTSNRDLARSLMPINNNNDSSGVDFESFMERLLLVMGGWQIQWDSSGMAKMIRKENLINKRRGS